MSIRTILNKKEEILAKNAETVTEFGKELHTLLDDMVDTMYEHNGVGLAAPQVGVLGKIAVVQTDEDLYELINPVLMQKSGNQFGLEGCLSCPDDWGLVNRYNKIVVNYQDRKGKKRTVRATDFLARAILHELDHLEGKLFLEKVERMVYGQELEEYLNGER